MKVAVVHEWLSEWAGSERVLAGILDVLPGADVFATVDFLSDADRHRLGGRRPRTTFVQRLPWARSHLEFYLPLMPIAVEQFDLSGYDLVVSNSHAVAKGVITGPDQLHLSYVHSPMRYAWDMQHDYVRGMGRGPRGLALRWVLHYLRLWDARTANGVDGFACNSEFIGRRIRKCYGRDANVIYPPVDVERLPFRETKEDFYLTASRLMPYKRVDLLVEAFRRMPGKKLTVIGDGPEFARLHRDLPANVSMLGRVTDDVLQDNLSRARAFLFAAREDFGILPVEAQACGTPVLAFGRGGARETIQGSDVARPTGMFFDEQTVEAVIDVVQRYETAAVGFDAATCRDNALRFTAARFKTQFRAWIDHSWSSWNSVGRVGRTANITPGAR